MQQKLAKASVTHSPIDCDDSRQSVSTVTRPRLDKKKREELLLRNIMRAWCALRIGNAYIASEAVVTFMDRCGSAIVGWRKLTDNEEEWRARPAFMPPKHGIETKADSK